MSKIHLLAALAVVAIGTGAGVAANNSSHGADEMDVEPREPYRCEIRTDTQGNRLELLAVIVSDEDARGSYRFKLSGGANGNRSNISQGGMFNVDAGEETVLGRMMLATKNAAYDVDLSIDSPNGNLACKEHLTS